MITKFIFLFLIVTPYIIVAQKTAQPIMNYQRMEGQIDGKINITANIIRLNDQLSGNYQYRFVEDNSDMYYGRTIEVNGNIDDENYARLKEFGRNEYAFNGLMTDGKFSGTWNAPDNKKLPFELSEYFPNGSLPLNVYSISSEKKLDEKDQSSPTFTLEATLLFPEKYNRPEVVDSVKKIISFSFFGPKFKVSDPNLMLQLFKDENLDHYLKMNQDWHKQGFSFDWEQMISMSVIFNSNYLLCLEYIKYAFSGGAHGMTNISYDIIYLENGNLLTYAEVFNDGGEEALSVLLTKQLRKDYKIPEDVSLSQAGFFVDTVRPNRNIYVNGNGIGFLYNSYEIAPYSQGATNIFLEFDVLKELVRPGTAISMMVHR